MRKLLGVLLMVVICIAFFFAVKGRIPDAVEANKEGESYTAKKMIEESKSVLENNYPEDPQAVIETYNKLYLIVYGKNMSKEYVDLYSNTIAQLYSKELLALNPIETIKENITMDLKAKDKIKPVIGTKMQGVTQSEKDGKLEENEVTVTCQYYTKDNDFTRTYTLIKEEGKWKIYSWEERNNTNE